MTAQAWITNEDFVSYLYVAFSNNSKDLLHCAIPVGTKCSDTLIISTPDPPLATRIAPLLPKNSHLRGHLTR
jgi:hypothetical protein